MPRLKNIEDNFPRASFHFIVRTNVTRNEFLRGENARIGTVSDNWRDFLPLIFARQLTGYRAINYNQRYLARALHRYTTFNLDGNHRIHYSTFSCLTGLTFQRFSNSRTPRQQRTLEKGKNEGKKRRRRGRFS